MVTRVNFPSLPILPVEAGDTVAAYRGRQVVRVPVVTPEGGTVTSVGVSMPAGFSVANSPVTTSGTITVTFDAGYGLPTTTQMGQWSTAYSWGDHASAGYALASAVTSALAGKVDTSDARLTDAREWTAATVGQAEAEAGTATTRRAWTAQRVFQAIAAWWAGTAEKLKLDGIQAGATANATDAQLRDRATHTGTQGMATIDGLAGALDGKVDKVAGYGLSQENFTPAEKSKLAGLEGSRFKGVFASLAALQSGVPSPGAGDYADVDAGAGQDVSRYIWDASDAEWVKQAGEVAPLTASQVKTLYESNPDTNAYTDAEKSKLAGVATGATANTGTVTSVQVAVPTGLQVAGGPVTTSGTLTISYATGYSIPANSKQSQWDAAYGWGNHASAGYAVAANVLSLAGGVLTGRLETAPSNSGGAGLSLPHGASPSSPANGDLWTTTAGLYARINGVTRTYVHTATYATVTQSEAEAGSATTVRWWTAQRVRQSTAAYAYSKTEVDNLIAGVGGSPSWTATTTTLTKNGFHKVDFSSNRTLTLPASPSADDFVEIYVNGGDPTGSTVARNGATIMGIAENLTLDTKFLFIKFVYSGTTWRILA